LKRDLFFSLISDSQILTAGHCAGGAHCDLLSQGEDLNCSVTPTAEEDSDSGQASNAEFEHEPYAATCWNAFPRGRRSAPLSY
jgi:hypothetical protein